MSATADDTDDDNVATGIAGLGYVRISDGTVGWCRIERNNFDIYTICKLCICYVHERTQHGVCMLPHNNTNNLTAMQIGCWALFSGLCTWTDYTVNVNVRCGQIRQLWTDYLKYTFVRRAPNKCNGLAWWIVCIFREAPYAKTHRWSSHSEIANRKMSNGYSWGCFNCLEKIKYCQNLSTVELKQFHSKTNVEFNTRFQPFRTQIATKLWITLCPLCAAQMWLPRNDTLH